jgi:hypothetical protein
MAEEASKNFSVSATGGAGSAGQPAQYMSSDYERTGDAGNMELQTSAKMNKSGVSLPQGRSGGAPVVTAGSPITPLTAFTERPDEPGSTGAAMGDGGGTELLASTGMLEAQNNEDIQKLKAFLPIYARHAESPDATNASRNFYRWLSSQ